MLAQDAQKIYESEAAPGYVERAHGAPLAGLLSRDAGSGGETGNPHHFLVNVITPYVKLWTKG